MQQLITIILAVTAFLFLALTITSALSENETKEAELLCHNSVAFRAATKINVGNVADVNLGPLLCKTIDKKVKGSQEEVKANLAYMMARCWWMFNEARQDQVLTDTADIGKVLGFKSEDNHCFMCYTAHIESIDEGNFSSRVMMDYLINEEHPKVGGMKYIDYFQDYGGPGTVAIMNNIYPNNAYGILFIAKEKDDATWTWADTAAVIGAGVFGLSCAISLGFTCAVGGVASLSYLGAHGVNALAAKKKFYEQDKPISMVVLDDLKGIDQSNCIIAET